MDARKLYEGKAKIVLATDEPDRYLMVFKDTATAFDGKKKGLIQDKGFYNAQISARLFQVLQSQGIPTHFIKLVDERTMLVRALDIIPVEVVVRNIVAGSLSKRLGRPEGERLPSPVVEFYYKSDDLGDPMICADHAIAFGFATPDECIALRELALEVNSILRPYFLERGLELVDFKLEFGKPKGAEVPGAGAEKQYPARSRLILGDEISPDTCRLWDVGTGEKLDKDRFRRDLGKVEEAYAEVYRRVCQTA
ncbi:MAG: phosphoribosylaminoimidazolesuccinocarboxamide synthase [Firmicutes bacterium]|nr:phosphoribosylaminoimidazolesuccinocarboxamide synthase [Candidatus Fermentithermobacillaceae bacterium]